MTSKKGNVISKNASEDDPAVVIERDGVSHSLIVFVGVTWGDHRVWLGEGRRGRRLHLGKRGVP